MLFTMIGRAGMVFRATHFYRAAGFIPSVNGVSLDGRFMTTARMDDIEIVADVALVDAAEADTRA